MSSLMSRLVSVQQRAAAAAAPPVVTDPPTPGLMSAPAISPTPAPAAATHHSHPPLPSLSSADSELRRFAYTPSTMVSEPRRLTGSGGGDTTETSAPPTTPPEHTHDEGDTTMRHWRGIDSQGVRGPRVASAASFMLVAAESGRGLDNDARDPRDHSMDADRDFASLLEHKYDDHDDAEAGESASPRSFDGGAGDGQFESESGRGGEDEAFVSTSALPLTPASHFPTGRTDSRFFTPVRGSDSALMAAPTSSASVASDAAASESRSAASSPASLSAGLMQMRQRELQRQMKMEHEGLDDAASVAPVSGVWMSVFHPHRDGRYGVSYYSLEQETLFGGEFVSLDAVQALKYRLRPDVIVTSAPQLDELHQALARNELDPEQRLFAVKTMKRSEFSLESALQRLRLLHVEELAASAQTPMRGMDRTEHSLLLRGALDLQQHLMVCALGALVLHLLHAAVFSQLESDRLLAPISVRALAPIASGDVLRIDRASVESLDIFVPDAHPASTAGVGRRRGKEGFSIFNVLDQTCTASGSRLLRRWISEPTNSIERINDRQEHIEYFTLEGHADLSGELRDNIRHVKDMTRLLARFRTKAATLQDWKAFVMGLRHLLVIGHLVSGRRDDLSLFLSMHRLFDVELQDLLDLIERVIVLEEQPDAEQDQANLVRVRNGIDQKLDDLRSSYADIDGLLVQLSDDDRSILRDVFPPSVLPQYQLLFLPQIGFLCRLPLMSDTSPSPSRVEFDFKFKTDAHIFYKNATARTLDEQFGDMQGNITDIENAIIREVQAKINESADVVRQLSGKIAELDCLLALATAAVTHHLVRPCMTLDPVLVIRGGRHLLLEQQLGSIFVANSTALGTAKTDSRDALSDQSEDDASSSRIGGGGLLHVLTGPNSSGKSVYLKQVGVIAYLAHTGSFVPAEYATVGVCDAILTRIKGFDSVVSNMSTFTYDTSQMAYLLRHCTANSLCLIDEYGKGTASLDGIALVAGVIRHLERLGDECPKALIATHFHEIYSLGFVSESEIVSFWRMDFIEEEVPGSETTPSNGAALSSSSSSSITPIQEQRRRNASTTGTYSHQRTDSQAHERLPVITCLYKLVPGVSRRSFGLQCATLAGVPGPVVLRAAQIANQIATKKSIASVTDSRTPSTAPSSPSFTSSEDDLWHQFLAFALHAVEHADEAQTGQSADDGRRAIKAEIDDAPDESSVQARVQRIDARVLDGVYEQFQSHRRRLSSATGGSTAQQDRSHSRASHSSENAVATGADLPAIASGAPHAQQEAVA